MNTSRFTFEVTAAGVAKAAADFPTCEGVYILICDNTVIRVGETGNGYTGVLEGLSPGAARFPGLDEVVGKPVEVVLFSELDPAFDLKKRKLRRALQSYLITYFKHTENPSHSILMNPEPAPGKYPREYSVDKMLVLRDLVLKNL